MIEGQRVLIWMAARGITPQVCKWQESPPAISPSLEPAERQYSQASQVGEVLQRAGFAVGEERGRFWER